MPFRLLRVAGRDVVLFGLAAVSSSSTLSPGGGLEGDAYVHTQLIIHLTSGYAANLADTLSYLLSASAFALRGRSIAYVVTWTVHTTCIDACVQTSRGSSPGARGDGRGECSSRR